MREEEGYRQNVVKEVKRTKERVPFSEIGCECRKRAAVAETDANMRR